MKQLKNAETERDVKEAELKTMEDIIRERNEDLDVERNNVGARGGNNDWVVSLQAGLGEHFQWGLSVFIVLLDEVGGRTIRPRRGR